MRGPVLLLNTGDLGLEGGGPEGRSHWPTVPGHPKSQGFAPTEGPVTLQVVETTA